MKEEKKWIWLFILSGFQFGISFLHADLNIFLFINMLYALAIIILCIKKLSKLRPDLVAGIGEE